MPTTYEERTAIRTLTINASTYTDIVGTAVLPIDCNLIVIYNSTNVDIDYRSDPGNSSSQVTIPPGGSFEIGSAHAFLATGIRFPRGCNPVGSLLSSSGSQSPIIESIL